MKDHFSVIRFFGILIFFLFCRFAGFAQLKANFTSSVKSGCSPLIVQFNDASSGNPTTYAWDFGNGSTSQLANPAAFYNAPGSYTVTLVITNAAGKSDSLTSINYITVNPKPAVDFNAVPTGGCAPLPVQFTDNSSTPGGNATAWTWDFGDGQVSSDQNPLHTYTTVDTFSVSLTVSNNFGCSDFAIKPAFITINGIINADFDYTYTNACSPPTKVTFSNSGNGNNGAVNYKWIFGDGGTSSKQNPVYTYNANGQYNVQLIASTGQGCTDTVTKSISIGIVTPDFVMPDAGCAGKKAAFSDSSSPTPISLNWTFGDGGSGTGLNPVHNYNSPGSYNVKLVANFGGCTDSITKVFVVKDNPSAAFSSTGNTASCKLPSNIQFNNSSSNAVAFQWNFGDGSKSTLQNPLHRYVKQGFFTVTLIAINSNGCSDTLTLRDYVKVGPPNIDSLIKAPFLGCIPDNISFKAAITSAEPVTGYAWDFGDGTTAAGSSPSHNYTVAGNYNVKLTATTSSGCSGSAIFPNIVSVGSKPSAKFSGSPTNGCSADSVKFIDLSTGTITGRKWNFGDKSPVDTFQNPRHQYNDTGFFTVSLVVKSNGCADSSVLVKYIHIKPPVAKFGYTYQCSQNALRQFSDSSIAAQKWTWTFGDGSSSSATNPSHTYAAAGKYAVTLTVTNGACTGVTTDSLVVLSGAGSFNYSPNKTNICRNDTIRFKATNFAASSVSVYNWDFGNGSKVRGGAADSVVKYSYPKTGAYSPSLTIQDVLGCFDTITKGNLSIHVFGPTAGFGRIPASCINSTVVQDDRSTTDGIHPIKKWIWYYGDGSADSSAGPPFQHTFTTAGIYDVKLTIEDTYGCIDSNGRTAADTVSHPVASFLLLDSVRCTNSAATFIDSSQGQSLSYAWNFGDNTSSTLGVGPQHAYKKTGVYNVSLVVSDVYGCTDTTTNKITISNPSASFNLTDTVGYCPPLEITPKNTGKNYIFTTWDFGDGNSSNIPNPEHIYTLADSYKLLLILRGHGNCFDTAEKSVTVFGPSGTFDYTPNVACMPAPVSFSASGHNIAGYQWVFGDGKIETTTDPGIDHVYKTPGIYLPRLLIVDSAGCQVQLQNAFENIRVSGVTADFGASTAPGCDSALVFFSDSSQISFDTLQSRTWDFGDGGSSADTNPSHLYYTSGTKHISLTLTTNQGCSDVYKLPVAVTVHQSPVLQASIPAIVCINSPAGFTASNSSIPPGTITWLWQFGNADTSALQNPSYTYSTAGSYTAAVTATNEFGCIDSVQTAVTVNALPIVDAGPDSVICLGKSVTFNPGGAGSYVWTNDKSLSCTNCTNPVATPDTTTRYYVTGTSGTGCFASDSILVQVKTPITLVLAASDSICVGSSIQIAASGAEVYNWQPSAGLSNASVADPMASPSSTTTYTVTATDAKNCFSASASIVVNVFTNPSVDITDTAVTILEGGKYVPISTTSHDVTKWQWTPAAGLSCNDCAQPVASPQQTTVYQEKVINQYGCSATDNVTVHVLCNQNSLFIPNTFSPNGDGMNDYFYPRGSGLYLIRTMRIFNRWGQVVFDKVNFSVNDQGSAWDGKYKGKPQPADVYVYVIDVICDNGTVIETKGNVTLLR